MVSFAKVFRNYFQESVGVVENQLGISLNGIGVYPLWQFGLREFQPCLDLDEDYNSSSLNEDILESKNEWLLGENVRGRAGNKGVYYPKILFTKQYLELDARQTLFHELYHIGLSRYGGFEDIFSDEHEMQVSSVLDEAFAEMMAIRTLQERYNLNVVGVKSLKNEVRWLEYELKKNLISTSQIDIANFVLSYDPWIAINDFEKWVLK